jgi:hypothetical protein
MCSACLPAWFSSSLSSAPGCTCTAERQTIYAHDRDSGQEDPVICNEALKSQKSQALVRGTESVVGGREDASGVAGGHLPCSPPTRSAPAQRAFSRLACICARVVMLASQTLKRVAHAARSARVARRSFASSSARRSESLFVVRLRCTRSVRHPTEANLAP